MIDFNEPEDFFTIYQKAAWHKDAADMIRLYDEQAVVFDMWNKGYHSDPSEWPEIISGWLGSLGEENVSVEFERITIHQAAHIGFASALVHYQAISAAGAVIRSMKNRITLGFLKTEGTWKVTHQHTSAPISSDGLTAILNS